MNTDSAIAEESFTSFDMWCFELSIVFLPLEVRKNIFEQRLFSRCLDLKNGSEVRKALLAAATQYEDDVLDFLSYQARLRTRREPLTLYEREKVMECGLRMRASTDEFFQMLIENLREIPQPTRQRLMRILSSLAVSVRPEDLERPFYKTISDQLERHPTLPMDAQRISNMIEFVCAVSVDYIDSPRDLDASIVKLARRFRYLKTEKPRLEAQRHTPFCEASGSRPDLELAWVETRSGLRQNLEIVYRRLFRKDRVRNFMKIADFVLQYQKVPDDEDAKDLGISPRTVDTWKQEHRKQPLSTILRCALH